LRIVDEVRRQVAAVELHTLHDFELVLETRALFDRDHAFLAHLRHGLRNRPTDALVGIGGNGADLCNGLRILARLREPAQFLDRDARGLVDAALQIHGIGADGECLEAFANDRLCQHGGRGRAITGLIGGARGDLLHQLRTHVLQFVLELYLLRHRYAILGDRGRTEALLDDGVASLGTQRRFHGVGENVDAGKHA